MQTNPPRKKALHSWRLAPKKAIAFQRVLREQLIDQPIDPWPEVVAGADIAYSKRTNMLFAAVILMRLPSLEIVEEATDIREARYPYVPGLLTLREAPAVLAAFRKLKLRPDAAIFDGQGRAHPRGMGLAAHLGLWLKFPTVGCAKSRLCGEETEPGQQAGATSPLIFNGDTIGALLRTRENVKPVYVSAGHLSNLEDSLRLVLECCAGYRLPEPTRLAHSKVTALRSLSEK